MNTVFFNKNVKTHTKIVVFFFIGVRIVLNSKARIGFMNITNITKKKQK